MDFRLFEVQTHIQGCIGDDLNHRNDAIATHTAQYYIFFHIMKDVAATCHSIHNVPDIPGNQNIKWVWETEMDKLFLDDLHEYRPEGAPETMFEFIDPMTVGVGIASLVVLVQMILLKNKLAMTLVGLMYAVIFLTTFCGGIIMQFEPLVPLLAYYMILYPLTVALCMMGRMHLNRVRDLERLLHTEEDKLE